MARDTHSATETARLASLRDHWILETDPEPAFDDLVTLAAQYCRTPHASISFIDEYREWYKAHVGWAVSEVPRSDSFAAHALRHKGKLFLVLDAREDTRFANNPLVRNAPGIRFYVAVPLVSADGHILGVLSVFDDRPRLLDDSQASALEALGRQAMTLLELRRRVQDLNNAVTARARAEESIQWQAGHDSLTGLPNRALFLQRLEEALEAAQRVLPRTGTAPVEDREEGDSDDASSDSADAPERPLRRGKGPSGQVALLFVDLDRFKRINDTLGHAAGDILLREVAARFSGCLRPEDTLARLGGDEFTVLLTDVPSTSYAASVSQMLLRTLRRPVVLGSQELHVGASIGISTYPRDGEDVQTLLKHADIAMYQAKEKGGYQAYSRRMNADGYQRLMEEGELRRAIERDELSVLYQPLLNATSGEVQSLETLARWKHPERGQVPPAHFISLAEQADLIVALGEWVLRRACRDVSEWRQAGMADLRVAVNLSARQLSQPKLSEFVESVLSEYHLPGGALDIELTETALCGSGDATPATLQYLRSLGIRVFVDDFGTGYSSLAYLRRFAVDVIKVDRAFVAGLGKDPTDEAIVRALIEMAHALGVQVVAEGVETAVQRDCLHSLGCDIMQGYLFCRPAPKEGVRTLLVPSGRHLRGNPNLITPNAPGSMLKPATKKRGEPSEYVRKTRV